MAITASSWSLTLVTAPNLPLVLAALGLRDALESVAKYLTQVDTRDFRLYDHEDLQRTQAQTRAALAKAQSVPPSEKPTGPDPIIITLEPPELGE